MSTKVRRNLFSSDQAHAQQVNFFPWCFLKNHWILLPEVTGTDEALALLSLGTGLMVEHLAGVLTESFLHHCQTYCDHPVIGLTMETCT